MRIARDVARDYLNANADQFGVTSADVAEVFVMSSYKTTGTGVTHVNVNQRHQGLEVFGGHATVNVGPDGRVDLRRRPAGDAQPGGVLRRRRPRRARGRRVRRRACSSSTADEAARAAPRRDQVAARRCCSAGGISGTPIEAASAGGRRRRLRLAWQSVIDDTVEKRNLWSATVDAKTGALLNADDWTSHDNLDELKQRLQRQRRRRRSWRPAFQQPFAGVQPAATPGR